MPNARPELRPEAGARDEVGETASEVIAAFSPGPPPNRTAYLRSIRLSSALGSVGTGSLQLAYPSPRGPDKPAALRPADGVPVPPLRGPLRAPRARAPSA